MAIEMHKARFLLASFISFVMLVAGYFLLIDRLAIVDAPVGLSYRQFLLNATDDIADRIIVESGSNAIHSINAEAIEKHFNRPTLIISDNAGYPLSHKIERLANHLKADDIVILPLEWLQYRADTTLPADYVESILDQRGSNAFYYRELNWLARFRFVYQSVPLERGLQSAFKLNGLESKNQHIDATTRDSLIRFEKEIRSSARGSKQIEDPLKLDALTQGLACDHYLFGLWEFPQISETFIANLQRLAEVREASGAKIFFAWPAVAARDGDECYQVYDHQIRDYIVRIQQLVKSNGFSFLGKAEQSRFDHNCILDTYYHIRAECAATRTQRLISNLEAQGLGPKSRLNQASLQRHLLNYLWQ